MLLHNMTKNGYVAELCPQFLILNINSVVHSLNMEDLKVNGSLTFTDICMSTGPNNSIVVVSTYQDTSKTNNRSYH